jgi:hypothetical protein
MHDPAELNLKEELAAILAEKFIKPEGPLRRDRSLSAL